MSEYKEGLGMNPCLQTQTPFTQSWVDATQRRPPHMNTFPLPWSLRTTSEAEDCWAINAKKRLRRIFMTRDSNSTQNFVDAYFTQLRDDVAINDRVL
jgi:hypothetical protein